MNRHVRSKFQSAFDALECRRLFNAVAINGTAAADDIVVYSTAQHVVVSVNNVSNALPLATTTSLTINALDGGDTIRVLDNGNKPLVINCGIGHDTVRVGDGQQALDFISTVDVIGESGEDVLVIDDTGDTAGNDAYTLTADTFDKSNFGTLAFVSFSFVSLTANPQNNDIDVQSSGASTIVSVNGGAGNDSIYNGSEELNLNWAGPVSLNGGAGTDELSISDLMSKTAINYAFDGDHFAVTSSTTLGPSENYAYAGFESVDFSTAGTDNAIVLGGTSTPTTIHAGEGADVIRVGDGVSTDLNAFAAPLLMIGGLGEDTLIFNDQTGGTPNGINYVITAGTLNRSGSDTFTYSSFDLVRVNATPFDDFALVAGSSTGEKIDLQLGDGADEVHVGNDIESNLLGDYVTINGGLGIDTVTVNDSTDAGNDSYAFTGNGSIQRFTKPLFGEITITGTNDNRFVLNGDANTIDIDYIALATSINAGAGDDTILVDGIGANVPKISGMAGLDTILIDDDGNGDGKAVIATNDELALLKVGAGSRLTVAAGANVCIASNQTTLAGELDLNDNRFIDRSANSASYWTARLRNGRNGGAWNGNGGSSIFSSTAAISAASDAVGMRTATAAGTFGIWAHDAGDTLLRTTLTGDADLNGTVDFNDLLALARNYNQTGRTWAQGDFNYDTQSSVNFDDLLLLARNFNQSVLSLAETNGSASLQSTPRSSPVDVVESRFTPR